MEQPPLVSIIIVNYNGRRYLEKCFDSLLKGSYKEIEIIFVDNGSSDGSLDFIRDNYPLTIIIDIQSNLGLSVASNKGAKKAKGKYLFFYNNDTIADKDIILNLVKRCESDKDIGICGCRTLTYNGKQIINEGVSCDIFGYPFSAKKVFYVDAAIFIKRNVFDEIGGFDEQMFLYGEDRDLCWRCWLYGYKVVVEQKAFFFHDSFCVTENIKEYQTSIKKRYLGEFNAIRSILKNYSLGFLLWILPLFIVINLAEVILFYLLLRFDVVKNVYIKAYIDNIRNSSSLAIARERVQKERRITDKELMKHMYLGSGKLSLLLKWGLPKFKV